jgi:hypothetical protein
MFEHIQIGNVTLNNLPEKTAEAVMELAQERPNDFVVITDGDESLIRGVELSDIISPEELLDQIADGNIRTATVIVSTDLEGYDLFIDNAVETRKTRYGNIACYLEYPLQD